MRILFPSNPLNRREADEPYREEFIAASSAGLPCSLFDFDSLALGDFRPLPAITDNETVLYRGWMLDVDLYQQLHAFIIAQGGLPVTSPSDYARCHHLPGWYEQCVAYTPETRFFSYDANLVEAVERLGWDACFVKDFVKSNTTTPGSVAGSGAEALEIARLIEKYRGAVEGGIAIRRLEKFVPETEQRFFVVDGEVCAPAGESPPLVHEIARLVDSPFYSVDTVMREDGQLRLVEIGDGQVSDRKSWPLDQFVKVLQMLAR